MLKASHKATLSYRSKNTRSSYCLCLFKPLLQGGVRSVRVGWCINSWEMEGFEVLLVRMEIWEYKNIISNTDMSGVWENSHSHS